MTAVPAMTVMFYGAFPPEVNTARLMAGAGVEPMYQAAAGWEALAISLETQAEELAGSLAALAGSWHGSASERAVTATTPMVVWLRTTALQAQKRAMQAVAQAAAYAQAMVTTPPLPEIEMNHVTHATLEATNFFGVNTFPIGVNEADYLVRMWNQAAGAMEAYQAETSVNTVFEPISMVKPIAVPGVGASTAASAVGQNAAMLPGASLRELAFAHVGAQAMVESAGLHTGRAVAQGNWAAQRAEGQVRKGENAAQQTGKENQAVQQGIQQGVQMGIQMGSQVGSTLFQLPQQAMQTVTQPLQQMTQIFGQVGSSFGSDEGAQIGLVGASPFSNHPLAGGSGAGSGAGLVRAASLPGMGGSGMRTPMLASLIAGGSPPHVPGAAAGVGGVGLAPVGVGAGGGAPMGMTGRQDGGGGNRAGLAAPAPLAHDLGEGDDDW